jgi:hypothetical protein
MSNLSAITWREQVAFDDDDYNDDDDDYNDDDNDDDDDDADDDVCFIGDQFA